MRFSDKLIINLSIKRIELWFWYRLWEIYNRYEGWFIAVHKTLITDFNEKNVSRFIQPYIYSFLYVFKL